MKASQELQSLVTKEFLSKISHHTRSPFNGLLGFAELLLLNQQKIKSEDATEYLLRVNMLAKKAFLSSENMVLWLKITTDNVQPLSTPFPFSAVLEHAYNLNKEGIPLKKIRFEMDVEENLTLTGDSFLTNCILANVISKAVKLCSDESDMILTAKTVKNRPLITVHYTGMEIESEVVRNFFSSQDNVGAPDLFAPELDIELWICYHLAKVQQMHFGVNFSQQKGTTFTLEA